MLESQVLVIIYNTADCTCADFYEEDIMRPITRLYSSNRHSGTSSSFDNLQSGKKCIYRYIHTLSIMQGYTHCIYIYNYNQVLPSYKI